MNRPPLINADAMCDRIVDTSVFYKVDLKTEFNPIRVKPEDIEKTNFNTKYGLFEPLVMQRGL